jgi:hypothetical protein
MDIRLVIFLAFTSVTLVANTLLVWFAYREFANLVNTLTESARPLQKNSAFRAWLHSLEKASAQALSITDTTKKKITEYEPTLDRALLRYGSEMAKVDSELNRFEASVSKTGNKLQRKVEGLAFTLTSFAAGINGITSTLTPPPDDTDRSSDLTHVSD